MKIILSKEIWKKIGEQAGWIKIAEETKQTFLVTYKEDARNPNSPEKTVPLTVRDINVAREWMRHKYPGSKIINIKQQEKSKILDTPALEGISKPETVVTTKPEQGVDTIKIFLVEFSKSLTAPYEKEKIEAKSRMEAEEKLKQKYPGAIIEKVVDLGIETGKSKFDEKGRPIDPEERKRWWEMMRNQNRLRGDEK